MKAQDIVFLTDPIVCTAARLESIAQRFVFEPMGLTAASAKIIKFLAITPSGQLTPTEIMRQIGGTKSNISQRLNFLEKLGYIQRVMRSTGDRRQTPVQLTAAGKKKYKEVRARLQGPVLMLEQHFTKAEIKTHLAFMKKMNHTLNMHEKELPKIFNV